MAASLLFALTAGVRGAIVAQPVREGDPYGWHVAQLGASLFAAVSLGWQAVHPSAP